MTLDVILSLNGRWEFFCHRIIRPTGQIVGRGYRHRRNAADQRTPSHVCPIAAWRRRWQCPLARTAVVRHAGCRRSSHPCRKCCACRCRTWAVPANGFRQGIADAFKGAGAVDTVQVARPAGQPQGIAGTRRQRWQWRRHERPFHVRRRRRARRHARSGKELVVATAGMDAVCHQRPPRAIECDTEYYAFKFAGKWIEQSRGSSPRARIAVGYLRCDAKSPQRRDHSSPPPVPHWRTARFPRARSPCPARAVLAAPPKAGCAVPPRVNADRVRASPSTNPGICGGRAPPHRRKTPTGGCCADAKIPAGDAPRHRVRRLVRLPHPDARTSRHNHPAPQGGCLPVLAAGCPRRRPAGPRQSEFRTREPAWAIW